MNSRVVQDVCVTNDEYGGAYVQGVFVCPGCGRTRNLAFHRVSSVFCECGMYIILLFRWLKVERYHLLEFFTTRTHHPLNKVHIPKVERVAKTGG